MGQREDDDPSIFMIETAGCEDVCISSVFYNICQIHILKAVNSISSIFWLMMSHVLESHYSLSQCSPQVSHNRCSSLHTSHLTQSQQTSPAHQHTHCKHINFLFSTTILRHRMKDMSSFSQYKRIPFYRRLQTILFPW